MRSTRGRDARSGTLRDRSPRRHRRRGRRDQPRRRGARRSRVHGHRPRAPHCAVAHRPASCSGMWPWRTFVSTTARPAPAGGADLVLSGTSGGDEGDRGFVAAYNPATGTRVWRFWTMPARGELAGRDLAGSRARARLRGGVADRHVRPGAKVLYWPTGNPCPDYNGDERRGDNLYSSSVVALDPADREAPLVLPVHAAQPARLGRDRDARCSSTPIFMASRGSC